MSVFARTSGSINILDGVNVVQIPVDASQNLADFAEDVEDENGGLFPNHSRPVIRLLNADGTQFGTAVSLNADNLPVFGSSGRVAAAGDRLAFDHNQSDRILMTVRVYDADAGAGVNLAMATVIGLSAAVDGVNFFLATMNWETTTTPAATNFGYAAPQCDNAADMFADGNGLICELVCTEPQVENTAGTMCMDPLTDADCEAMMSGSEPNDDRNECVFTAGSCSGIGGVINSGTDGCDFTDASCGAFVPGMGANAAADGCAFTSESCMALTPPGADVNSAADGCEYTSESCMALMPPGADVNSAADGCEYTADSCNMAMEGSTANTAGDDCTYTAESCSGAIDGATVNNDGDDCTFTDASCDVAAAGTAANDDNTGCLFTDAACAMLMAGSVAGDGRCECPVDSVMLEGEMYCANFAAPVSSLYTTDNCTGANAGNWTVAYELDSSATPAEVVAELCAIPYERPADSASSAGGGLVPLQIRTGDNNNCVIRANGGATAAAADPLCGGDSGLFANRGFPIKPPTGFDASTDRLTVDPTGAVSFGGDPVPQFVPATGGGSVSTTVVASAPASKKSGQHALGVGVGLGVLVYLYSWHYYDGDIGGLFNFSPDYGYSVTESGYSYRYGGRLDFRNDDLHLYWKAGQANSNGDFGDFRYESGGEYTADFWTASFSEVVRSEESDYDFSLSADYRGGIWRVSPTYRLRHSRYAEQESETANSLNLEGVLRYNRWTISPSAGFNWESADEFGDNARFNLSAVRRF